MKVHENLCKYFVKYTIYIVFIDSTETATRTSSKFLPNCSTKQKYFLNIDELKMKNYLHLRQY